MATTLNIKLKLFIVLLTWSIWLVAQFNLLVSCFLCNEQAKKHLILLYLDAISSSSTKLHRRRITRRRKRIWQKPGRTEQWWRNMISGKLSEDDWKKNFRMSKVHFQQLVNELRPFIEPKPNSPNYTALSAEKKLAITLYTLKDTGSFAMTANTFGISLSTVSVVVVQVCKAIVLNLGKVYVKLPKNVPEMQTKIAGFEVKFGMVQAFGCVDGTHIPIKRPVENSQDYFCYKNFFSLNVQAVCDSNGLFMDVDCRWPGSVHDAKVFANSSINKKLNDNTLPVTFRNILPGRNKIPNYLIGDPAYALTPYCMKEYLTCTSNEEVVFNNMLRSARNPIECAFGRLNARWSILTKPINHKLETVPIIVYTCFVLHNFCEINRVDLDEELVRNQMLVLEAGQDNRSTTVYACNTGEGEAVRHVLMSYIKHNLPDHLVN